MNVAEVRSHFKALIENPKTCLKSLYKNFKQTHKSIEKRLEKIEKYTDVAWYRVKRTMGHAES